MHKTGTTAIQSILAQQRADLAEHGVIYPGDSTRPTTARRWPSPAPMGCRREAGPTRSTRPLDRAAADVPRHDRRGWSSAASSSATCATPQGRAAGATTSARTASTSSSGSGTSAARLSSAWQQTLKHGPLATFDRWLQNVYLGSARRPRTRAPSGAGTTTARRVARWADVVGAGPGHRRRPGRRRPQPGCHDVRGACWACPPALLTGVAPPRGRTAA